MFNISPYGSSALLIQFKDEISLDVHQQVISLYHTILSESFGGVISVIPAYNSITIRYSSAITFQELSHWIEKISNEPDLITTPQNEITIPVCYDKSLGLDIDFVSQHTQLSHTKIIALHTSVSYPVYMIGFTPGFPYLGGLNKKLHTPRKATPRLITPKGAIGLANSQTGIYPNKSPGGWQIIGQTPISIFTPTEKPLVNIGDLIRFESISLTVYNQLKNED